MLKKASAYLYILGNDIYTGKNSSTNICLFIMNNSNTRKRFEICSKLTIKSPQRRSTVNIVNFDHISYLFTSFCSVSTVDFEQVNVCWVPPYQFIELTAAIINRCRKILVKWQLIKKDCDPK